MELQRLFDGLSAIHPLSEEFKNAVTKEAILLSLPKGYMLLEAPRISEYAYFLSGGFAMSYIFVNGKKHVESFWGPEQIIISTRSFFEQVPSTEFIQLMQQSDILCFSYNGVMRLIKEFPEANFIYQVVMNQYHECCRDRIRDLHHFNTEERFAKLLRAFPSIEQIVPQEYIASYLGIAPQSLSRIKRAKRNY